MGIENPAGVLEATIEARLAGSGLEVRKAAYRRSTQILLRGHVPLYRASDALRGALLAAMPMSTLTEQFLAWVADRPRTYADAMEAWRSTCPRLSIWEDALGDELVRLSLARAA